MIRTANMLAVGLLVLFLAAAGNAAAASGPSSLNGSTWSEDNTSITTPGDVTMPPNALSIDFKRQSVDLKRGVDIARGSPKPCEPYPPQCKPVAPVVPNKG
jgi:hypothetical protein